MYFTKKLSSTAASSVTSKHWDPVPRRLASQCQSDGYKFSHWSSSTYIFYFSKHGGSDVIVVTLIGLFVISDFVMYHENFLCGMFQSALRDFEDIRAGGPMHNRVDGRIHNVRDRGRQLGPHRRAFPMDKPRVHISVTIYLQSCL